MNSSNSQTPVTRDFRLRDLAAGRHWRRRFAWSLSLALAGLLGNPISWAQYDEAPATVVPRENRDALQEAPEQQDDPQRLARIQQHKAQFEPLLESELNLAILVGRLAKPQRESVRQAARQHLDVYARQLVEGSVRNRRGVRAGGVIQFQGGVVAAGNLAGGVVVFDDGRVLQGQGVAFGLGAAGNDNQTTSDPHAMLGKMVAQALEAHVSAEVAEKFLAERQRRTAWTKKVIIDNILAGLDEKLLLTTDQREQLTELIDRHWHSVDPQLLDQFTLANHQTWLPVPDGLMHSLLTPTQRRVWTDRRLHHTVMFNAMGIRVPPLQHGDDVWRGFDKLNGEPGPLGPDARRGAAADSR
jgi:hypothetical protein